MATIQIHEMSALDAGVDKTSGTVRFKDAISATVDALNPLVIPAAGTIYSFTKKLRLYMEAAPDTQVDNLRWYSTDAAGFATASIGVTVVNQGATWTTQDKVPQVGGVDLFSYTSGAPLDGDGTDVGPFTPADDGTYIGDLIELQMTVASTAGSGTLAAKNVTAAYDEI